MHSFICRLQNISISKFDEVENFWFKVCLLELKLLSILSEFENKLDEGEDGIKINTKFIYRDK